MASRGTIMETDMAKNTHFASAWLRSRWATCGVRVKRATPAAVLTVSPPAHAADRQIGAEVDGEGDEKEQGAGEEQHAVVVRSRGRLAQPGGGGRGPGADRVAQPRRHPGGGARR